MHLSIQLVHPFILPFFLVNNCHIRSFIYFFHRLFMPTVPIYPPTYIVIVPHDGIIIRLWSQLPVKQCVCECLLHQAQARCHRIGQSKSVKIYRLITRNSYEREMFDKASLKLGLDKAVLQSMSGRENANSGVSPTRSSYTLSILATKVSFHTLLCSDMFSGILWVVFLEPVKNREMI